MTLARVRLPAFGLGGGPLGNYLHPITDEQADAVVETAWEAGVRYFDTAPFYGLGLSERRLGRVLRGMSRASFLVSTKVGRLIRPGPGGPGIFVVSDDRHPEWDFSREGVLRSVEESLDRLGLDTIDILLLHDPDHHWREAIDSGFPALAELRAEGVVKAIGVGMNQSEMLLDFVRHADPDVLLAANQCTLLRRTAFAELLPACEASGIPVIAASVFHRGVLAEPPRQRSDGLPPDVTRIADLCTRHGVPIGAAALQFPLRHRAVTTVLAGAHDPAHIHANITALNREIPEAFWAELS